MNILLYFLFIILKKNLHLKKANMNLMIFFQIVI